MLYVPDADVAFKRAVEAGARVVRPLANQFSVRLEFKES
jgi:uncharacterized glyoxalase superfamily protein PhnB